MISEVSFSKSQEPIPGFDSSGNADCVDSAVSTLFHETDQTQIQHLANTAHKKSKLNGFKKITLLGGEEVEAHFKNGRLHGQGRVVSKDGGVREGEFEEGFLINGCKKTVLASGAVLEKQFANRRLVRETLTFPNGAVCEGQFKNNRLNGRGQITFSNGKLFKGEFENGELVKGTIFYPQVGIHEGQFKNGRLNGHGKITLVNGGVHKGQFKEGRLHGHATIAFSDGTLQEGQFENDELIEGRIVYPDVGIYEGQFKNERLNGHGKIWLRNNEVTEGQFKEGRLHGHGTITFADGSSYIGQFESGELVQGTVFYPKFAIYRGEFEKGKLIKGKITYASGDIHIGQFKNCRLNGFGKKITSTGRVYEGEFINGVFISADSNLGDFHFGQLLMGAPGSEATREYPLGILIAFLARDSKWMDLSAKLEGTRKSMIRAAADPRAEAQNLFNQFIEGHEILLASGSVGHAVMISFCKSEDGNEVVCSVHNAGDGISVHHLNDSTTGKYQTNLVFKIPLNQFDVEYISNVINIRFPSIDAFYQHITCNGSHQVVSAPFPIWQSPQKGPNCSLKSPLVFLRSQMPKLAYKQMKQKLYRECLDRICHRSESFETPLSLSDHRVSTVVSRPLDCLVVNGLSKKITKEKEREKA